MFKLAGSPIFRLKTYSTMFSVRSLRQNASGKPLGILSGGFLFSTKNQRSQVSEALGRFLIFCHFLNKVFLLRPFDNQNRLHFNIFSRILEYTTMPNE